MTISKLTPLERYVEQINRNLVYWTTAVLEDDQFLYRLPLEKENIIKAVGIGLNHSASLLKAIDLILLLTEIMDRTGAGKVWLDQIDIALAKSPEREVERINRLKVHKALLHFNGNALTEATTLLETINDCFEGNETIQWELTGLKAFIHLRKGEYEEAAELCERLLSFPANAARRKGQANHLMGAIHFQLGKYTAAISHFETAVQHLQGGIDSYELITVLESLGLGQLHLQQKEAALNTLERAYQLQQSLPDQFYTATVSIQFARVLLMTGRVEAAEEAVRLIDFEYLRNNGLDRQLADVNALLGEILTEKGEWAEAEMHFDHAVEMWERLRDEEGLARTLAKRQTMWKRRKSEK